jgi:hypothetical protein
VVVYGAGKFGKYALRYIDDLDNYEVVAVIDKNKVGKPFLGHIIKHPDVLKTCDYDEVLITPIKEAVINDIETELLSVGVEPKRIRKMIDDDDFMYNAIKHGNIYEENDIRVNWLRSYSAYTSDLAGAVAECGVDKGDFAYYINKYYCEKSLYLFDTFEGFTGEDIEKEKLLGQDAFINGGFNRIGGFEYTSEQLVYDKMPFKDKVIICKGYFPDTAKGLNETFCFVNLDMDLYQPTLAALEFFYEKMCDGGVILCHDYFHPELPGIKMAIADFETNYGKKLHKLPIGDDCSIAIVK